MPSELTDGAEIIGGTHSFQARHQVFRGITFEDVTLTGCELRSVTFSDCSFIDCSVEDCTFEASSVAGSALNGVRFLRCRLLGLNFAAASQLMLSLGFRECQLDYAGFSGMSLRKTLFADCRLRGADFQHATLDGATFSGNDLSGALFNHASLKRADLRQSSGLALDPANVALSGTRVDVDVVLDIAARLGLVVG